MKGLMTAILMLMTLPAWPADWQVDRDTSRLGFTGTQQGGRFEGYFQRWDATIRFDPQDLADSQFEVVIDVASVNTRSRERDQYVTQKEWLAAQQFPTATFRSTGFTAQGDNAYLAQGDLTLRGVTRPVTLTFSWMEQGDSAELRAQASLNRLDFGIGQGEFADSSVVGHQVQVNADLQLRK